MPLFWEDPNVDEINPRDRTPLIKPGNYRLKALKFDLRMRENRQTVVVTFEVLDSDNAEISPGQLRAVLFMVAGTQFPAIGQGNFLALCNALNGTPVDSFGRTAQAAVQHGIFNGRTVRCQSVGSGKFSKNNQEYTNETWLIDEGAPAQAPVPGAAVDASPPAPPPAVLPAAVEPWEAHGYIQHPNSPNHVWNQSTNEVKAKASFYA